MPHRSLNPSRGIERLSYWWVVAALAITATTGSQAEAKPVAPGQRGGDALNRGEKASLTLTNCQFIGNSAQSGGGGMWVHFQLKEV
ncbi:MAG: hypothetical protein O7D91_04530 [Planctomycetota bacterium]|nr:hypothetical protein [Planctomycetota bacterium]